MEKQYNVFEDDDLIFTGMEREANIVFDRLNTFLEHTHENVTMSEYNINITETPWYKCYDDFNNGYYSEPCFNDIEGLYDSTNKYVVKNNLQLKTIVNSSPVGANLSFIDTSNIAKCPNIKQKMILNWDTSTFTSYTYSFCVIYDDVQPYQYDLDWLYISNGADISDMFFNTKFCKKLPRTETNMSFGEFVNRNGNLVTGFHSLFYFSKLPVAQTSDHRFFM